MFWRSLIQWLGGMGIIVLSVAILPFLGVGGMQLYKAEVPSPVPDKLKPRIRDTAMILWKVYALISLAQVALLMLGGMSFFEALCHTFTTMPTGGFSTRNASVAHYNSVYIDSVIIVFMMLAGINFSLHYQVLQGKTPGLLAGFRMPLFPGDRPAADPDGQPRYLRPVYETIGRPCATGPFRWCPSSPPPVMPPPTTSCGRPCPS